MLTIWDNWGWGVQINKFITKRWKEKFLLLIEDSKSTAGDICQFVPSFLDASNGGLATSNSIESEVSADAATCLLNCLQILNSFIE